MKNAKQQIQRVQILFNTSSHSLADNQQSKNYLSLLNSRDRKHLQS